MSVDTQAKPGAVTTPLVTMRGIDVLFGGVHAVNNVDLDLYPGTVTALLGHNGAGKSTLVKVLAGALRSDAGEITIDGRVVNINSPRAARAAGVETIYQTLALAGNLDSASNMYLGRELRSFKLFRRKAEMRAKAAEVLNRINPHFKNIDNLVETFSGGQKQSIAIGRAVLFEARVLILDEPTAALGPSETAMFKDLVTRLRDEGVAILLISHDMGDVFELADKLVVMSDGQVVGRLDTHEATKDQVLGLIILGGSAADEAMLARDDDELMPPDVVSPKSDEPPTVPKN